MSVLYTNSGVGADQSPLAGDFTTLTGAAGLRRISNKFAVIAAQDSGAYVNTVTPPNDQYAKVTIDTVGGSDAGPACRMSTTQMSCYFPTSAGSSTEISLISLVNGSFNFEDTDLAVYVAGQELYIEAQGTTILTKLAGVTINTATDASLTSGRGGMFMFDATIRFTNLEIGDFQAADTLIGQFIQ